MLTRWNDWAFRDMERTLAEFDALRREMNRLFDDGGTVRQRKVAAGWPRVGLYDRGSELVLRAELPGVAQKDIDVTIDQHLLTLRGERNVRGPEGYSVHRQERGSMRFARSFTLPCRVDSERANATLANGMLTLVLPKAPEDQPRHITVKAQ